MPHLDVYFSEKVPEATKYLKSEPQLEDPPGVWLHGTDKVWHSKAKTKDHLNIHGIFNEAEVHLMMINRPGNLPTEGVS